MHRPERYNAKARAGGTHKKGKIHKKRQRDQTSDDVGAMDVNAEILELKSTEDKETERKARMRQQLLEESNSKASSKKKKRLDKYIDKKLKKEERLELFEKLAKSQAQLPSTLHLQSSSTLGTGRPTTNQARLDKQEDKEIRRAMDGVSKKRKRPAFSGALENHTSDSDSGGELATSDFDEDRMPVDPSPSLEHNAASVAVTEYSSPPKPTTQPVQAVGSALRRNADGTVAPPRVLHKKEKGKRTILQRWKRGSTAKAPELPSESDTSFDSSDSAYDSSDASSAEDNASDDAASNGDEADSNEGSGSDSEGSDGSQVPSPPKRKLGAFKQWATAQLSAVKGYVAPIAPESSESGPSLLETSTPADDVRPTKKQRTSSRPNGIRGPLGEDLALPSTSLAQSLQANDAGPSTAKRKFVSVTRPPAVEEGRLLLPIVSEEQQIMEAILLNPVVVICGETGSGKTTQVPQFLYEAGFGSPGSENPGMIGITQPRRVAAISMASRVAHELSLTSSRVSYQIRYDATVSPSTSIKFMTDGVLLRELATDFLLSKYSVIIIDEAHERSMNTDILIGVLSRVIKLRESMWKEKKDSVTPLRLIIMSATLRVNDFTDNQTLFPSPPPVISVAARQHPVTVHFSRRTVSDYVTEAVSKASKIHARLPPGGVLIFLTGQNEIIGVCRKLEEKYGARALEERKRKRTAVLQRTNAQTFFIDSVTAKPSQVVIEAEDLDLGLPEDLDLAGDVDGNEIADDEALDTDDDEENEALGIDTEESEVPMHIVPLYSLLPSEKQMRVFEPPPPGTRLVVVSTNVAETSLTIPGIRYVIDCGRAKERKYTIASGIQSFQVGWISKASAAQRAGRAGRTGPGHCYRLYSSAVFENYFDQFSEPEILRVPIEGVVLQMKSMHIDAVVNFPFPTPPHRPSLLQAEKILTRLGALNSPQASTKETTGGHITSLGRTMSLFPLSPRFSRMIISGKQHNCLPYIVAIVSALSVGDPFIREEVVGDDSESESDKGDEPRHLTSEKVKLKEHRRLRRKAFFQSQKLHASLGGGASDLFRALSVIGAYEYAGGGAQFCAEHFVRAKAMDEIHKLRAQMSNIVSASFQGADPGFVPNLKPPTAKQMKVLRQLLAAGFIDQVAVRKDLVTKDTATGNKYTTAKGVAYRALGVEEDVFIHPSSVLADAAPPDYIIFHEIIRTTCIWLKGLTVVNSAWLASLGKPYLCTFSKAFKNRAGELMVTPRFGPEGWELPAIKADV